MALGTKTSESEAGTEEVLTSLQSLSLFGKYDAERRMWRRQLPNPYGEQIVVYENPNEAGIGGEFFLWPASLVLADVFFRNPSLARERGVLELGASHGLASMAAHAAGARRVLATDQADVMAFLTSNLAANPARTVEAAALEWGVDLEAWGAQHGWKWDIIVGSDLTFNKDCSLPLLFTLQQLMLRSNSAATDSAEGKHAPRALLLHDDDSVPGGKHLRADFFGRAAKLFFNVTPANLSDSEVSIVQGEEAFNCSTVHAFWLTPKQDAQPIALSDCATALRRWSASRLRETQRQGSDTRARRREPLGFTVKDMLAHFQKSKSDEAKVPLAANHGQKPYRKALDKLEKHKPQPKDERGLTDPSGGAVVQVSSTQAPRAHEGTAVSQGTTVDQLAVETKCLATQGKGANWWDDPDLGDYEPFEFTDEMLRGVEGVQDNNERVFSVRMDPDLPNSWEALLAAEAADAAKSGRGLWRDFTVDTSSLPTLTVDKGQENAGDDDEDEEVEDMEDIVDFDSLRAAARTRYDLVLPSDSLAANASTPLLQPAAAQRRADTPEAAVPSKASIFQFPKASKFAPPSSAHTAPATATAPEPTPAAPPLTPAISAILPALPQQPHVRVVYAEVSAEEEEDLDELD